MIHNRGGFLYHQNDTCFVPKLFFSFFFFNNCIFSSGFLWPQQALLPNYYCISKNYYRRPEGPVHQKLRTLRMLTISQDVKSAGRHVRMAFPIYPCVLDVHQVHESRCPQIISSPASQRPPSGASLIMAESNSTLASGRLSKCLVFRMLHSDI